MHLEIGKLISVEYGNPNRVTDTKFHTEERVGPGHFYSIRISQHILVTPRELVIGRFARIGLPPKITVE